ncbi:expressed unknown protein [Seminavis robusta]|uniref:Transmembrane protein n=1 Tax=Seminavis robusta TaxID=568900 RepID=A0A9N8DRJ3_9STRA|nr:expressed unknown protein [Seminavis robusta]|eukprot:Sro289_g108960.1 n/a (473) ;mRNA; f:7049-8467
MTQRRRDPITDASSRSGSSSASSSMSSLPDPGQSPSRGRSRRKRRSTNGRRHNNNDHEEPFWWTFAKVGGYLLIFCATCYILLLQRRLSSSAAQEESFLRHETLQGNNNHNNNQGGLPHRPKSNPPPLLVPSIGVYEQELARQDTFGIAYQYLLPQNYSIETASQKKANKKLSGFAKESALLLQQFTTLVGGEEEARAILQRSLLSQAPSSSQNKEGAPRNLATRLQHILHQKDGAFQVVILGSTAAAGSGVLHNQSYASVLQNNMEPIFQSVGIRWNVTNLAIEDTAEFPTIWCLDHFISTIQFPDVIIWDYGYTSTADSLEAFLRNVVAAATQHNRPLPFLIFRDNKHPTYNDQRDSLLQTYVDHNVLMEPVLVHADRAAAPYFRMNREHLPVAFQGWRSHATLPGDARLTVPHHGMIGWLLSMHLLSALELVVASPQTGILPASKHSSHCSKLATSLCHSKDHSTKLDV